MTRDICFRSSPSRSRTGLRSSSRSSSATARCRSGRVTSERCSSRSNRNRRSAAISSDAAFFLGFFIAIGAFNALLYVVLRDAPFGWYATSMFSLVGLLLVETRGFGPAFPRAVNYGEAVTLALYYIALTGFCRSFLNVSSWRGILDCLTLPVLAANVVLIFVEKITHWSGYGYALDETLQAALLVLLFGRGWLARREGFGPARFYLIAFAFAAAGILINDL